MNTTDNPVIDFETVNQLLANKQSADSRLKKALEHRSFYQETLDQKDENGEPYKRIVCVVKRGNPTTRLLNYVEAVKEANKQLLEKAPQYFDSKSIMFREPTILYDVQKINVTINKASSSRLVTGTQLVKLVNTQIRKAKIELGNNPENDELKTRITALEKELVYFKENPEKKFRRRSPEHRDLVAICHYRNPDNPKQTLPAQKTHINAGGLIVIRHRSCTDQNVTIMDNTSSDSFSIYDEVTPLKTALEINGHIYDEHELELVREARKKLRGDNVNKPRSQFDGLIN